MNTEEFVEKSASLILVGSPEALLSAAKLIAERRNDSLRNDSAKFGFSRVLQEILAYKRGAVVDQLLQQVSSRSLEDSDDFEFKRLYACKVLVALSENEAVAKYCAKEEQSARLLAKAFVDAQAYLLGRIPGQLRGKQLIPHHLLGRQKQGNHKHFFLNLALENVKGFASFSFASKTFRLALQTAECGGFFPGLESLLAREIFRYGSSQLVEKALKHYSNLMRNFCLFRESQSWAFDHGMVRIHAALARLLSMDGATEWFMEDWMPDGIGAAIVGGASVVASATFLRIHLATSEQGLLKLDKQIRDARDARAARKLRKRWLELGKMDEPRGIMPMIGMTLGGSCISVPPFVRVLIDSALELAKVAAEMGDCESSEAPIVCSWEDCDEGSVEVAGRKFSKCAKCSLAFYCSKEHQRLHWASHKKQCSEKSP